MKLILKTFLIAIFATSSAFAIDSTTKTAFDGKCAWGATQGMWVAGDCKKWNWKGPDGATYCFSSETALKNFAKDTNKNLTVASQKWAQAQAAKAMADAQKMRDEATKQTDQARQKMMAEMEKATRGATGQMPTDSHSHTE
ncbi:MAG TPA: hypothetical protein PKD37_01620 [Oligoflexia bacterium]|nr:hypothetical protein [Oligoflexia bacterium]HMP26675.1 hypothetical protein [Oligoflexia bacterium]